MAYENFKPEIWSHKIQHELPKYTVFEQDCNYQFKGDIGLGKTVHVLGVARPTIGEYTPGQDIDVYENTSTKTTIVIDKAPYFNFMVDDVDEAQSIPGVMEAYMEEATRAMGEARDSYIAGLAAKATHKSTVTSITGKEAAKAAIDKAIVQLMKQGVKIGRDKVTAYLTPEFFMHFADYVLDTRTQNDKALATGELGNYMGMTIKVTNNAYNDGTNDHIIIKTDKAIAFASCINEVEAYRPEKRFSDAVKGLNTFGGEIVRQNELYVVKAKYTA
jgi:hypothetical protein